MDIVELVPIVHLLAEQEELLNLKILLLLLCKQQEDRVVEEMQQKPIQILIAV